MAMCDAALWRKLKKSAFFLRQFVAQDAPERTAETPQET
jgi:hypothetical protein